MRTILLGMLLMAAFPTYSQSEEECPYTVMGQVLDEHDGSALAYATVQTGASRGVTADDRGRFLIEEVCSGKQAWVISHLGCEPDSIEFVIQNDTQIVVYLEHHTELLEVLRVEAIRPHEDIEPIEKMDLHKVMEFQHSGLAQLVESRSGVRMLSSGGNIAKPMIRGLEGNRLLVSSDGVTIEGQQWGKEHAPEVDAMMIESVEIVKGAGALRFGPRAMGGVIKTSTGELGSRDSIHGWVKSDVRSNGRSGALAAKVSGRLFKGLPIYGQVAASAWKGGDLQAPDYYLDNTGSEQRALNVRAGWIEEKLGVEVGHSVYTSDLGILRYAHIGNLTDLQRTLESGVPPQPTDTFARSISRPRQAIEHYSTYVDAWWKPRYEDRLELKVTRQYDLRQEFDNTTFSGDEADLQYQLSTITADLIYTSRTSELHKMEWGGQFIRQANTYAGRFFIPNFLAYQGGVFTIHHFQWDTWEVEAGARYDRRWQQAFMYRDDERYTPIRRFEGLSFNAGLARRGELGSAFLDIGWSWRPPSINELYSAGLHHGAAALEFGDEGLNEERMVSLNLGQTLDSFRLFGGVMNAELGGFTYLFDQFIYLIPDQELVLTVRGAFPSFTYRPVNAWFRGAEASADWRYGRRWHVHWNGDLQVASELESGKPLIQVPAPRSRTVLRYVVVDKPLWLQLQATWEATAQKRFTSLDQEIAPPPQGYSLFHARVLAKYDLQRVTISSEIGVQNILNTPYRDYLDRLRFFAQAPGRNFFIKFNVIF